MKTIYARLGDLQLGETLEDGTTLGSIGEALDAVGVNIQTSTGDLRDMGDVIEELMGKWQDLDTAQKQALAVKLAGKYQYNNLMALLENSKMYEENLEAAQTSLGTINQQQDIYLDSLEGKLNTLQSTFEGFINSIFNVDDIKPFIDDITGLIKLLTGFTTSIGTTSIFSGILGVGAKVFSSNIGDQVMKASENRKARKKRQESIEEGNKLLSEIDVDSSQLGKDSKTFKAAKSLGSRTSIMNESQRGQSRQVLSQMAKIENDILDKREKSATILNKMEIAYKNVTGQSLELKMNEEGQVENLDQALLVLNSIKGAFKDIDKSSEKASDSAGKMLASLNSHAEGASRNKNNGFNAKTRDNMFSASTELDDFVKGLATNKKLMNSNGENILSSLPQYQAMMEANTAFGEAVSKMPTKGKKVSQTVSDEVEGAFNKSRQAVVEFIGALQKLDGVDEDTAKSIQELLEKLGIAKSTLGGLSKDVENFSDSLDMKQLASDTADFVGSLAQAYSAFQSIKSLGKIVNDSDMESGEKISSFIENLLFSAPMLITSMVSLNTSFKNVRTSLKNWNNGLLQSAGIAATTATATDRLKVAVKGVMTLLKSNGLTLLLSLIPTAISFAMGAMEQQAENAKQESQEVLDKYDELKDKAEQTQQAQQKVKENYDIYKQTGKVTDELKDSIQAYADTLDVPLSKQNLWNENIDKTIEKLNEATAIQANGMATAAKNAADQYQTNFLNEQASKRASLTDHSTGSFNSNPVVDTLLNTEGALNNNKALKEDLESIGVDLEDSESITDGIELLYKIVNHPKDVTEVDSDLADELSKKYLGDMSLDADLNSLYSTIAPSIDFKTPGIDDPVKIQELFEEALGSDLSELMFGLNDDGELEVTVKANPDLAKAASQLDLFSTVSQEDLWRLAGVTDAEEGDGERASLKWRISQGLRSGQVLSQDENILGYKSSSLTAAKNELAGILYQKQNNGETITIDTLLDLLQNSDTITRLHEEGFSADDVGGIAVDLADLFNITLDEDARKQIEGLERTLSATSKNAADVAAEQERAAAKQRAAQYVGDNQFGLKGTNYIDKVLIPTATKLLGISEDNLYSMIESNRGRLTPDANYDNILNYYKDKNRSGADMDLVAQVLASEEGLINAINGNTDALDSQYDVLVYQKNLKQGAEEKYRASQAFTGKSDKAIDAELEAANQTINEKLNSTDYSLTDSQKTSLIADVYSHLDEVIAGTYDWDAAIKRVVTNLDDLSDATKTTQEAFDKATPKIMAVAEGQLKEEKGEGGYTDEDVKNRAEEYGQNLIDSLGDEGAQAVFAGISSGLFDVEGIQNWVTSALKAGASKKMIVEWLKEAVQNGVHVDINAEYDGELDSQIFEKDRKEREAQEKAETWNPVLYGKANRIIKETGVDEEVARIRANKEVTDLDASLKELNLTADDVIAMGIDLNQSNEAIIEQVKAIQSGDAKGIEAAGNFNGLDVGPLGKFADTDKNGFNDAQQELWEYAKGLGYTKDEFAALVEDANRAGLSTEEFRQHLENLTYGLDSISKNAQEAAEALARAGMSTEQRPVYDEFGNATGSYTSDVQETVSNWDPWMTDQLASVGMFDKENTAALQDFLNLAPEIQFAAVPYLDSSQLDQQVAELNLDPPDFFLKAQIVDIQDAIESVQSSISNGSDIDADALEKIYSVAPELREINLAGKEGEQALKDLNTQLNSIDIEALSNERSAIQGQLDSLTQQVSDYDRGKIGVEIDKDQALKDIDELNKQLDKINTEIDIKIKTNADQIFDDMQSMEDEIESVKAAFDKNGGIINAETFQQALEYYPNLINYTTEYGNNLLQVSSEGQAAWVAAAEAQQAATIEEKQAELQALAQYYFAQADAYEAAAAQYDQMANAQLMTDEEVSSSKASIDENLTNALAENDTLVADNAANATNSEMKNSSDLVNQANADNALMVSNTQSNLTAQARMYSQWANSAISNANQVANAMSKASKGQTSSTGATPLTIGAPYGGNASVTNTTGNTSTTYKSTSGSNWNAGNYRKKAQEEADALRKAAQANRDMGNKLLGESTAIGTFTKPGSNSVGGKGSGGGSGSGDGSSYDPKTKEKLEDEADRYEKVNAQIDKLNNALEQLNTEEERLVGFNRINIIQKETENIKRQIEVYKEKLKLQKEERDEIKKRLEDDFKVEFDSEGYISNYQNKFEEYLGGINNLIDQYNSTATEEGQEALDKEIENAQKAFEDFKDLISKYDDINSNTIKETEKDLQDLHDKIEDMITDLFNKAVEAVDTIKEVDDAVVDLKKTFRDFNTEEDDPFLSAEISDNKIASYFDAGTKSAKTFFDTAIARLKKLKDEAKTDEEKTKYQAAIDGLVAGQKLQGQGVLDENGTGYLDMSLKSGQLILQSIKQYNETGKSDLFGENQQAMMEAAKTVFDQLTDMASSLREEIDNLRDSIIDAIDLVADEIEKREDLLDSIGNRLDHLTSMSQILHGNTIQGYEEQNKILAVQSQLADQRLAEATQELDYWNQIASTVIKGSKEEEEALNHVREATEKKNEAIENSANLYKQQVQASANLALAQWQKQWLGTDDMEWAQTQWEMMNRNADYYLDDVNKAYNIQKLQSQYTDLLDGANTLDIQTKITDQMNQQLEYLRTKTNLSEYDVSYAQAQLEILKQQIALEEAQANKSQMKLRRDSQGNYNYVYTANEDNVKSAQDSLLDAQNNAYNLSKDQMKQTQEDSFSAFQQAKQLLLDIWSDTTLGVTEQKERMQAVIDNLVQYLNMTGEQLSTSQANLLESFYGMVDSLNSENVGSLQEIYDKLKEGSTDAFDSIDTRWSTTITTLLQNKDKFADSMADLQTKMEDSLKQYNTSIENASNIAKENIGDISDSFDGVKSSVEKLTESFGLLTNKLVGYIDKIGGYSDKLKEYQTTFDTISQENGELRQTITDLQDEINKMKLQEAQGKNEAGIISTTPSGSSGKGNGKGDNNGDGKGDTNSFGGSGYSRDELMKGIAFAIFNHEWDSGWGDDPQRRDKLIKAYGEDFADDVQNYINANWYNDSVFYPDYERSKKFWSTTLVGYDTGGYTGDWSDGSGKLALLHSKEIVLNANDTQNILKAVESVRAMTAAMKGATLAEAVGSISSIGKSIETANSRVDQNVNITAEFPNATSADEIREAILGLNNQVLHYTHKKA